MKLSIKLIKRSFYLTNEVDFGIKISELHIKNQKGYRRFISESEIYIQK
jgi:hypothetical protein